MPIKIISTILMHAALKNVTSFNNRKRGAEQLMTPKTAISIRISLRIFKPISPKSGNKKKSMPKRKLFREIASVFVIELIYEE